VGANQFTSLSRKRYRHSYPQNPHLQSHRCHSQEMGRLTIKIRMFGFHGIMPTMVRSISGSIGGCHDNNEFLDGSTMLHTEYRSMVAGNIFVACKGPETRIWKVVGAESEESLKLSRIPVDTPTEIPTFHQLYR